VLWEIKEQVSELLKLQREELDAARRGVREKSKGGEQQEREQDPGRHGETINGY